MTAAVVAIPLPLFNPKPVAGNSHPPADFCLLPSIFSTPSM